MTIVCHLPATSALPTICISVCIGIICISMCIYIRCLRRQLSPQSRTQLTPEQCGMLSFAGPHLSLWWWWWCGMIMLMMLNMKIMRMMIIILTTQRRVHHVQGGWPNDDDDYHWLSRHIKSNDDDGVDYWCAGTTQCMLQALGAWPALYTSLLISCKMSRGPVRFVWISFLL